MYTYFFFLATVSERMLYFHSLASITENIVPLRILDNNTAWESNPDYDPRSFIVIFQHKKKKKKLTNIIFFSCNPRKLDQEVYKVHPKQWTCMEIYFLV